MELDSLSGQGGPPQFPWCFGSDGGGGSGRDIGAIPGSRAIGAFGCLNSKIL